MKTTQSLAALLAIGSLGGPVFATPLGGKGLSILNKRGAADIAVSVLSFISSLIPPEHNSWDYDVTPDVCSVEMGTASGGSCHAAVTCHDGVQRNYDDWNVCYKGGRQFFTDPAIGDFSVTFTGADSPKDGLYDPILQVKAIGDWMEINVQQLSNESNDRSKNDINEFPNPANVCGYIGDHDDSTIKSWKCGIPVIGKGNGPLDSEGPVNAAGFAPGWCDFHVIQYQKPNPATDKYKFDVTIVDSNQDVVGSVTGADATNPISVTGKLPNALIITAGNIDDDAVLFNYGDQAWGNNDQDHHCNFGAYDSGKREGDCGFTC